jgi:TPR repeat protein
MGDTYAFFMMGTYYSHGRYGLPQDITKALEFYQKAGKFGYTNLGTAYYEGNGVERDEKMARHY